MAVGGSTNAIVHLTAIAGRLGIKVSLERFNELSDETPVLVDLKPVGEGYMEDFHAAGGMGALLARTQAAAAPRHGGRDVEGRTLAERLEEPAGWVDRAVIRPFDDPISPVGGSGGAERQPRPGWGHLQARRRGDPPCSRARAGRSCSPASRTSAARIDDPALDVRAGRLLVLQECSARTRPACRRRAICRSRRSWRRPGSRTWCASRTGACPGTAFGSIVLHVAPEAAVGGPLAAVRNGDRIRLSVAEKRLDILVDPPEISRRLEALPSRLAHARGYEALYQRSVLQAPEGCDFDFLVGSGPAELRGSGECRDYIRF